MLKTIILPGYSLHNKDWAYETKIALEKAGLEATVYEWRHWKTNTKMDFKSEVLNIRELVGNEEVNIIAKSVGTKVFMQLFPNVEKQINKVILCGIPFDPAGYLKGIKSLGADKLVIIQNSHDPFIPYSVIDSFVKLVNPNIKVIKHESDTHDYPYFSDFTKFLQRLFQYLDISI